MRILAIDTSTGPASAALVEDGMLLASHEDGESMRQSQRLVGDVDSLMRAQGGYKALDAIAVTTGPGGFTGIRVALAAARGMALACNVPLLGISSLETFGWQALHDQAEGAQAVAFVNAFRNQAYVQAFARTASGMHALCEAQALDMEALAAFATGYPQAALLGNLPDMPNLAGYRHFPAPHARYAGFYALALWMEKGQEAIAARPAEAYYIRPPDAKPQKPLFTA